MIFFFFTSYKILLIFLAALNIYWIFKIIYFALTNERHPTQVSPLWTTLSILAFIVWLRFAVKMGVWTKMGKS